MQTYLQGTIIKKTQDTWVIQNSAGTYWIEVHRHPSFTHKYSEIETGFWVRIEDIKRFRPNDKQASN